MIWTPHATVATVVKKDTRFLLVEERCHDKTVYNQPAGHVEESESIFDAATRETLEETGWSVELLGLVGVYTYTAPENGVTYYRFCFAAQAVEHHSTTLDEGIIAAHWKTLEEIQCMQSQLRSPLVLRCIEDYLLKPHLSLETIYEHSHSMHTSMRDQIN